MVLSAQIGTSSSDDADSADSELYGRDYRLNSNKLQFASAVLGICDNSGDTTTAADLSGRA
jgi:hypothetical protein